MKKLADVALLPFYCQNTLFALLLINFLLKFLTVFIPSPMFANQTHFFAQKLVFYV
jgi:hypothetical protein